MVTLAIVTVSPDYRPVLITIRLVIIGFIVLPSLGLGILQLANIPVPTELVVVTLGSCLLAVIAFVIYSSHFARLYQMAMLIHEGLDNEKEDVGHLVEPIQSKAITNDEVSGALVELADRLCQRRRQMRDTIDKLGGILITLSQNRPLEFNSSEFDVPDQDDRTMLLGSLCQLITSMQQVKQRGDVFANVLRESPIAMLITDADYKIRSLNPAAEKLFGYKLQQLTNHSFMELFIEPPIKDNQAHLRKLVLPGKAALSALKQGRQEVFTTVSTGYGKVQLIGLRASFGTHCLFVIRERSKDKVDLEITGPETIHLDGMQATIPMPAPVLSQSA